MKPFGLPLTWLSTVRVLYNIYQEGEGLGCHLCIARAAKLTKYAAAVGGSLPHLGLTAGHAAQQAGQEHFLVLLAGRP